MKKLVGIIIVMVLSPMLSFASPEKIFSFKSIDGGEINLEDYKGKAVLITNTASRCGFTKQYKGLQSLHKKYEGKGLVVLAIPSNDFNQELATEKKVKEFCDVNFGLTMPMSEITSVRGRTAHPFYKWLKNEHDFQPNWNFYKVLVDKEGQFVQSFNSLVKPNSRKLLKMVDEVINRP